MVGMKVSAIYLAFSDNILVGMLGCFVTFGPEQKSNLPFVFAVLGWGVVTVGVCWE